MYLDRPEKLPHCLLYIHVFILEEVQISVPSGQLAPVNIIIELHAKTELRNIGIYN